MLAHKVDHRCAPIHRETHSTPSSPSTHPNNGLLQSSEYIPAPGYVPGKHVGSLRLYGNILDQQYWSASRKESRQTVNNLVSAALTGTENPMYSLVKGRQKNGEIKSHQATIISIIANFSSISPLTIRQGWPENSLDLQVAATRLAHRVQSNPETQLSLA